MSTPHTSPPSFPAEGSSLSLALKATPAHRRQAAQRWLAWWHEVSQIPCVVSDPGVADRKLAWWAQACQDACERAPAHPLLRAMTGPDQTLVAAGCPPLALWLSQLAGLQTLTQQTRWMDEPTLVRHMRQTTGAACEGWAWIAGVRSEEGLGLARDLGVALRRAHILFRLGQDAQSGWLHLPIDRLQKQGVRAHELLRPPSPDSGPEVVALLDDWAATAREDLLRLRTQARQSITGSERAGLAPLVLLADLSLTLLDDLRQQGYPVLKQRLVLGPWRKLWSAQKSRWR